MPAKRETSWNKKTKCSKGLTAEKQALESITAVWISEPNLLMRKAKVTVITGSLIPKGGFQWITEMWNQRINNNFHSFFTFLSLNQLFAHLTIPLRRSVLSSLTNPFPCVLCQKGQIQDFLTLVKLIIEENHKVGLIQTGTDPWWFFFYFHLLPHLFFFLLKSVLKLYLLLVIRLATLCLSRPLLSLETNKYETHI